MTLDELAQMPVVTVEQLADVLQVGRTAAYEAVRRGDIRSIRIGRTIRIPVPVVLELIGRGERHGDDRAA